MEKLSDFQLTVIVSCIGSWKFGRQGPGETVSINSLGGKNDHVCKLYFSSLFLLLYIVQVDIRLADGDDVNISTVLQPTICGGSHCVIIIIMICWIIHKLCTLMISLVLISILFISFCT